MAGDGVCEGPEEACSVRVQNRMPGFLSEVRMAALRPQEKKNEFPGLRWGRGIPGRGTREGGRQTLNIQGAVGTSGGRGWHLGCERGRGGRG